ncbi:MAG: SpoIIE family protein phosphatase, partial [Flavobacteriaceae bacterium]|nr:SpoIIE family protein phosphatase [Flavobacteriaceae bacterium]
MPKSIFKSFLLINILACTFIYGQIKSIELTLSNNNVNSVLKANNGLLWVGTQEGLNVFYDDDRNIFFSNIEDSLSILNSDIQNLSKGINEELIVLSKDGLSVFDSSNFSFFQLPLESEPSDVFLNTHNKTFWVTTKQSGIYVLDENLKITNHFEFDPLNPLSLSTSNFDQLTGSELYFDEKSRKTFIATQNGLNVYDENINAFKRFFKGKKTTFSTNQIIAILPKMEGKIGIITQNEFVNFYPDENRFENIRSFKNLIESALVFSNDIILLKTSKENFLLRKENSSKEYKIKHLQKNRSKYDQFVRVKEHLYLWENKGNEIFKTDLSLNTITTYTLSSEINTITYSNFDEQLYIGSNSGVSLLSEKIPLVRDDESGRGAIYFSKLNKQYIEFQENSIEMGSFNKNKRNTIFNKKYNQNFSDFVFELLEENILLGGEELLLFDTQKKQLKKFPKLKPYLEKAAINNIKVIENDVYCSLENGVLKIKGVFLSGNGEKINEGDIILYEYNELLNPNAPKNFNDIEKIGDKFYVTDNQRGLILYDKNLLGYKKSFAFNGDSTNSLASSTPTKLFFDEDKGVLYVGTIGSGLFKYSIDSKRFSKIDISNGLLSNNIFDFLKVDSRLFIQTGSGINFIEDDVIKNINNEDGLTISNFHRESMHQFENTIVVTGNDKIQTFKIVDLDQNQKEFRINALNIIGLDDANTETILPISENNTVDFDYKTNTLIFDLFSNNNFKSDQVKYYFKRGENGEAVSNGYNNKIQLSSFSYYTNDLEIYAINADGQKSANTLTFSINNAPPWWLRIETIVVYLISSIILIYSLVKIREAQTKKRLEGERKSKELEEAKELQNSLLPKTNPTIEGYQISTYLKSATEIGGDYYDFFYKKGEYFYAICGDATGHGVISGIMVSVTKAGLNGIVMGTPSKILQQLNRIVKRVNFGRLRMSLSVAKLNKNSVELSSAAMPPTYYYNAKAKIVEEVLVPNLPLGGIETEEFDSITKDFN